MLDTKQKLQTALLGLMALVGGISAYQTVSKIDDAGTPDKPKPDTPKADTQISPPPIPLPIKVPNLLDQPEVVNDVSAVEVPSQTPPPIPVEIKKTPDEVKRSVELEVKRLVYSKRAESTKTVVKKDSQKFVAKTVKETPPKIEMKKTKTEKYPPGSWSERRKELGYSAKDSLVGNPKLMAEYNKWKASR